jgi:hypothetical protein
MARHKMGTKRKKKKTATRSTRRRRVGAGSGKIETVVMNGVAVAAGQLAANELAILMGSFFPSLQASPMIDGAIQAAGGLLLSYKGKSGFLSYMGYGIAANGVYTILKGAGVINGPSQSSYMVNRRQMGDPRLQFVAGPQTRIGSYPNNFKAVAGAATGQPMGSAHRKPRYSS